MLLHEFIESLADGGVEDEVAHRPSGRDLMNHVVGYYASRCVFWLGCRTVTVLMHVLLQLLGEHAMVLGSFLRRHSLDRLADHGLVAGCSGLHQ